MATRDELLNQFETDLTGFLLPASNRNPNWTAMPDDRSAITESETSVDGADALETHICFFWDEDENMKRNAQFYVRNRGDASETATWQRNRDPKPPAEQTYNEQVYAYLRNRIGNTYGDYTIRHIGAVSADNISETGTAEVLVDDSGTSTLHWIDIYLYKDGSGNVQWEEINA